MDSNETTETESTEYEKSESEIYLPNEMWKKIFELLDMSTLMRIRLVCQLWAAVIRPIMTSKMTFVITQENISDIKRRLIECNEIWPFDSISMKSLQDSEDLTYILNRCKPSRSVTIYNSSVFECLAKVPMPHLTELIIHNDEEYLAQTTRASMPENWHLSHYRKLSILEIKFLDPAHSLYPKLLSQLLEARLSIPLKELRLSHFDCYDVKIAQVFLIHADTLSILQLKFACPAVVFNMTNGSREYEELRSLKNEM